MDFINTEEYLRKKIEELKLPFISVLAKKDGKVIFNYSYKFEDKNNDMLCMYSMSKPITVVALMQCVEKGLVNVNDKVEKYLPGFDSHKNIDTGEEIKEPILVWNLLSMTAGLDYCFLRPSIKALSESNPNAGTIEACSCFAKDGTHFAPGKGYQYSLSVDVAAAIVEKVTGVKFSTYVEENIFNRVGMKNSTFKYVPEVAESCRKEYWPEETGLKERKRYYKNFFPTTNYESGGAGLISTVEDYSLFIDSLANRKEILVKDSSVDEMSKIVVEDTPFNEDVCEFSKASVDYGYGYGVRVRKTNSLYGIPKGEFGWDGATGSYSLCDRKNNISIVIGLTIQNWPVYVKNLHIMIAENIYKDINKKL